MVDLHTEQAAARLTTARCSVVPSETPKATTAKGGVEEETRRCNRERVIVDGVPVPGRVRRWASGGRQYGVFVREKGADL